MHDYMGCVTCVQFMSVGIVGCTLFLCLCVVHGRELSDYVAHKRCIPADDVKVQRERSVFS